MQFPQAQEIATITNDTSSDANVRASICAAIYTAVETPGTVTTSSLDCSSLSEENLLKVIAELQEKGYGVTSASTGHITVTWPSHP
jgi:hypothetical protein